MKIQLLFFAAHRRTAGISTANLEVPDGATAREVSSLVALKFGLELRGSMVAVNDEYADPDRVLRDGDALAFIPPVSGGTSENFGDSPSDDVFEMSSEPLDLLALHAHLVRPEWGGQAHFTGSTRSPNKNETIVHLEYEAYPAFCFKEMQRIANQARERWELGRVVIAHRMGTVLPGQVSIFIGASSAHRKACLEAVPWILDEAKARLPVWKLEVTQSGQRWVEGSTSSAVL
jgi:MoaE-MoaD fusion protein